jgi:hypothetical protein
MNSMSAFKWFKRFKSFNPCASRKERKFAKITLILAGQGVVFQFKN